MPRVLRIITRLNVGGPATHAVLADQGLRELGWETLLVHGQVEPDEAEIALSDLDIPTRRVRTLARPIRPAADARAFAEIVAAIRRHRPHVIHTHLSKAGLIGRIAALGSSRAVRVHTFHGNVFGGYFGERASGAIVRAEQFLGHRTHRIIALSERQQRELIDYRIAQLEAIRIVPLGLDLARFRGGSRETARAALGISPDAFVLVAIGRLVPIKRIDRLLRSFARFVPTNPMARLYLVGDGSERGRLVALANELGVDTATVFVGWSTDTPRWYAAADVVCLTSDREGTPLALIEAAAAERPVVAFDVGGVADIVADGETGFVVPPGDEEAFAERLGRLTANPELRARMAAAAPGHATRYDAHRLVADLDTLYRSTVYQRDNSR